MGEFRGWRVQARKNHVFGRVAAPAAAVLLAVGVSGCSGSSQKPAAISGPGSSPSAIATSASSPSASPTATAQSSPATTGQPTFKFPADYTLTVDPDTTGDPVKDAILADNANFLKAYSEALASGDDKDPLLLRYATPVALGLYWQNGITSERAAGLTITGAERFYNRVVYSVDNKKNPPSATVHVCDDQSKSFDKEIATGKVHLTPVTDNSYTLYFFGMQQAPTGVWQITSTIVHQSDQADKQTCR